jgi:hypothetical protein
MLGLGLGRIKSRSELEAPTVTEHMYLQLVSLVVFKPVEVRQNEEEKK